MPYDDEIEALKTHRMFQERLEIHDPIPDNSGQEAPFVIVSKNHTNCDMDVMVLTGEATAVLWFITQMCTVWDPEENQARFLEALLHMSLHIILAIPNIAREADMSVYLEKYLKRKKYDNLIQLNSLVEPLDHSVPLHGIFLNQHSDRIQSLCWNVFFPGHWGIPSRKKRILVKLIPENDGVNQLSDIQQLATALKTVECHCLNEFPSNMGELSQVSDLLIQSGSLDGLPGNLDEVVSVRIFDVEETNLDVALPQLKNLCDLTLKSLQLETLPANFGTLCCLKSLTLLQLPNLQALPHSFGNQSLCDLTLESIELEALPTNFGSLVSLTNLNLVMLSNLWTLPDSFRELKSLEKLKMHGLEDFQRFPESFGLLPSLKHLTLQETAKLEALPESFGLLPKLEYLRFCNSATAQHNLPQAISSLPNSFGQLKRLRKLFLSWLTNIADLPDSFSELESLQDLTLSGLGDTSRSMILPSNFGALKSLVVLTLEDLPLTDLPVTFGELSNLEELYLTNMTELKRFPSSFASLGNLQFVDLFGVSIVKGTATPIKYHAIASVMESLANRIGCFDRDMTSDGCLERFESLSYARHCIGNLTFPQLKLLIPCIIVNSRKVFHKPEVREHVYGANLDEYDELDSDDEEEEPPKKQQKIQAIPRVTMHKPTQIYWLLRECSVTLFSTK